MKRLTTIIVTALALSACGGGGGGGTTTLPDGGSGGGTGGGTGGGGGTPPPTSGINGGGRTSGAITGFGSIFVNGVEFSTSSATIRIDDNPGVESDLRIGQVVEVRGTIDDSGTTGTADEVIYDDSVEGPIASIDLAAGTFVVLGQQVRVTGTTTFDDSVSPAALTGLDVGDVVEVSGFPAGAGEFVASRIEPRAAGGELEVKGSVQALDTANQRFTLGALTVDYRAATIEDGSLANAACVEVKGTDLTGDVLTATRVQVESCDLAGEDGELGEIEGYVTRFGSSTDFDVGGQRVTTTSSTVFEGGVADDLRVDLKVEVEGQFDSTGVLVAKKVDIRADTSIRALGPIDALDAGTLTAPIFGIDVEVTNATRLEDKSSARIEPFGFADLRTGDYVEVRGFAGATAGSMVAALLERDDPDPRRELQGTAQNVVQPAFEILGVSVATDAGTEYRDVNDVPISAAEFYSRASNRIVSVRGVWNGSTFVAEQAELESP